MGTNTILVAAGGTGGHILPGIHIGRELERRGEGLRVLYACGSKPIEAEIYRREGIDPIVFPGNYGSGGRLRGGLQAMGDLRRAHRLLREKNPATILAMGGGACAPILGAAVASRVPFFLHESNAIAGRVTRLFRRFARQVFLGLGGLEGPNVTVTGTPTRDAGVAPGERRTVLCLGGSQGARRLNELFAEAVHLLPPSEKEGWDFLLVHGPANQASAVPGLRAEPYITDLAPVLARTAFAVTRAGAGTLADLANFAVPALLVPYPFAKDNHQDANARIFERCGASLLRQEEDLTAQELAVILREVLAEPSIRAGMRRAARRFSSEGSAARIADIILEHVGRDAAKAPLPLASREVSHGPGA